MDNPLINKIMRNNWIRAAFLTVVGAATTTVTYLNKEYEDELNRFDRIETTLKAQGKSVADLDKSHVDYLEAKKNLDECVTNPDCDPHAKVKAMHEADAIYGAQLNMLDERDRLVYFDQIIVPPPSLDAPSIFLKSLSSDGVATYGAPLAGEGTSTFKEHATIQDRMDHKKKEIYNSAFWGAALGLVAFGFLRSRVKPESKEKLKKKPEEAKAEEAMRNEGLDITVPQADNQSHILSQAHQAKRLSGHDDPKQVKGHDEPKQLPGHSPKRLNP